MSREKLVIIIGAALVLLAAAGIAVTFFVKEKVQNGSEDAETPLVQQPIPGVDVLNDAKALAANGDVAGANKLLDEAIAQSNSTEEQSNYYALKSTNTAATDINSSVEDAKKSADLFPSAGVYGYVGELAEQAGNTALAIEYYEKAVKYDNENPPIEAATRGAAYFQSRADALRGL